MKSVQQRLGNQTVGEAWQSQFILQNLGSKAPKTGTSLVSQWLRLHAPNESSLGQIPDLGTRAHRLQLKTSQATVKLPRAKIIFFFKASRTAKGRAALEGTGEPVKDGCTFAIAFCSPVPGNLPLRGNLPPPQVDLGGLRMQRMQDTVKDGRGIQGKCVC